MIRLKRFFPDNYNVSNNKVSTFHYKFMKRLADKSKIQKRPLPEMKRYKSNMKNNIHEKSIRHVLVVDDEEPLLLSIADGLSIYKKYFNLLTATDGVDAVKIIKSTPGLSLVITDLNMPKMDGFELMAYLSRNYPRIPVILMTAYGTPKIEEIVKEMGIFRYLEKPLDISTIAESIFEALEIKH